MTDFTPGGMDAGAEFSVSTAQTQEKRDEAQRLFQRWCETDQ